MAGPLLFITPRFGSIARGVEVFTHEVATRLAGIRGGIHILSGPHDVKIPGVTMIKVPVVRREIVSKTLSTRGVAGVAQRLRLGPPEIEAASLLWNARNVSSRFKEFQFVIPQGGLLSTRWARYHWPMARIVCIGQAGVVPKDLRLADAFVAMIPDDEEIARSQRPQLPIATICHGVDLQLFSPSAAATSQDRLLCVAALVREKGHHHLLDAFLHLPPSVVLTCVGAGPELERLQRHPAFGTGRVRFTSVDRAQMPATYQSARAFTLPAMDEVFGIVFVEAIACGLPVVAHDGPRQREVLGQSGYFADVRDAKLYAAALLRALEAGPDPERRSRVMHLDWAQIAGKYAQFLDSLV